MKNVLLAIVVVIFSINNLFAGPSIKKTVIIKGQSYNISYIAKDGQSSGFVTSVLPKMIKRIGQADWYATEMVNLESPKICVVHMVKNQVAEYFELSSSQYDYIPIGYIGDLALAMMDLKPGQTIAMDDSFYFDKHSPALSSLQVIDTKDIDFVKYFKFRN